MNDTVVVLSAVSAIVAGTPILLAALGELIAERSGVMKLGVEGMMLLGAVVGFWTGVHTGSLTLSLLAGGAAGALLACVHGLLAVSWRVNQTVSGLSLVIVGTGLSAFLGSAGGSPLVEAPNGVSVHPLLPSALRDILASLGAPLIELAVADRHRVQDATDDWGSYYATSPRVYAGYLRHAEGLAGFVEGGRGH